MLHTPIDRITETDLQALVTEGRREGTQIEFKLTLPGGTDDERREFLKDVSAMANSQGGDIIYGIREDRSNPEDAGKAAELVPITDVGADATKLRMFELLNSSIEPRINGVVIREVSVNSGFALVVRVPRSWNSPHVVRHRNHWRFYARNSAGVYAMDVSELRNSFLLSDTLSQQLESLREARLAEIFQQNPTVVDDDWSNHKPSSNTEKRRSLLAIHLQPFDSVKFGNAIDVSQEIGSELEVRRLCSDPWGDSSVRLNFDGLRVTDGNSYLQVYRSGVTEEIDATELGSELDGNRFDVECIGATELDRAMFKGVGRRLALLKLLGVSSPVLVSVSLLGVRGCKLFLRRTFYVGDSPGGMDYVLSSHTIDRANLFLTGIIVENLQELQLERVGDAPVGWNVIPQMLRTYCDSIWNAVGYRKSQYFDPDGKWLGEVYRQR